MSDETEKDTVIYSEKIKEQMAADPDLAEAMREFAACCRQAQQAVKDGRYATFDDAMEAITGNRPEPVDVDGEDD
jgi:hypothetical protein